MNRVVVLAALLLGGCSFFPVRDDRPPPVVTSDEAAAALDACRRQAGAVVARDAAIDRDIAVVREGIAGPAADNDLVVSLDAYGSEERQRRIVAACMRRAGYPSAEDGDGNGEAQAQP